MTKTAQRVATIHGVALAPGVSKNGRLYTTETITRAHDRLKERLADPAGRPVVMRSLHPASGSDMAVTNVAGQLTSVAMNPQGQLTFDADVPDTSEGRDVAALLTAPKPYLKNVSIRGWWLGTPKMDAEGHETADDLEIDGLDYVTNPGVEAAQILAAVVAESHDHPVITESVEEVTISEVAPTPGSNYADPGYQSDGKKRYPLDTTKRIRAAWAYINVADNAKPYTAAQLKRIKGKIKAAAKKADVDITAEMAHLADEIAETLEAYASTYLDNGQGDVRVTGYTTDPSDLAAVGRTVASAALAAMVTLDPDNDGDIDIPGGAAPGATCSNCGLECEVADNFCPSCGAALPTVESASASTSSSTGESTTETEQPVSATATTTEETKPEGFAGATSGIASPSAGSAAVEASIAASKATETKPATETTTESTETAPVRNLTDADVAALAEALKPKAETTEATASTTTEASTTEAPQMITVEAAREMTQAAIKEAADQMKTEITQEAIALVRSGGRKGVVRPTDESGAAKPLHEMSEEERNAYASEAWGAVLGRSPA